jgi:GNAT superfamily N-acetyltransferase
MSRPSTGWRSRSAALVLRLATDPPAEFRDRRVTRRLAWLASTGWAYVGLIDVDQYADATAGVALVVAPALRGQGLGRRIIQGLLARPELERVSHMA